MIWARVWVALGVALLFVAAGYAVRGEWHEAIARAGWATADLYVAMLLVDIERLRKVAAARGRR